MLDTKRNRSPNFSQPKFQHDCECCEFLGHYLECDVWLCQGSSCRASIIARFSSQPPDYASSPLSVFKQMIIENHNVGSSQGTFKAQDILFGNYDKPDYWQAWMLALAFRSEAVHRLPDGCKLS